MSDTAMEFRKAMVEMVDEVAASDLPESVVEMLEGKKNLSVRDAAQVGYSAAVMLVHRRVLDGLKATKNPA